MLIAYAGSLGAPMDKVGEAQECSKRSLSNLKGAEKWSRLDVSLSVMSNA